jgi:HEAT repeat protein
MALKNAPSSADDYANVHRVLQDTLQRDDQDVRRHASYQIGEWATSSDDLAPLRTMAIEEPDFNARVRAVMSIGTSNFRNTENKNTLYAVVENDEEPLIRLKAWEALEAFPLNDMEKADYVELGERIQLDVEAYEATMSAE